MIEADIAILGAGPAGAAAGLTLAPRHRVLLLDRQAAPEARIGESLIPAARRLLRDMRVLDAFEAEGHAPYLGNRSIWGGEHAEVDFLRDPDGPGWHLDRARFERFLRAAARRRGAMLLAPARLQALASDEDHWHLEIASGGATHQATARLLVDAGGRNAPLARRLGAARSATDQLVACWLRGTTERDSVHVGFTLVESEADGWWYAAAVPNVNGRPGWVLAFHTDHDLEVPWSQDAAAVAARARRLPGIGQALCQSGFHAENRLRRTAANSGHLTPACGAGWLAIGDAALSFDPLASRGIFNALYTAMTAAMICHDALEGAADLTDYAADLTRIRSAYVRHLAASYAAETRWSDRPFWRRRRDQTALSGAGSPDR